MKILIGFKGRGDDKMPHERLTAAAAVTVVAGDGQ
jgi:hypothetical protein